MLRSLCSGVAIAAVMIAAIPGIPAAITATSPTQSGGASSESLVEAAASAAVPIPTPSATVMETGVEDSSAAAASSGDAVTIETRQGGSGETKSASVTGTATVGGTTTQVDDAPGDKGTVVAAASEADAAAIAPAPSSAGATEMTTAVCPSPITGSTAGAPGTTSAGGVAGTTSSDLASFAARYNEIRVANCLPPVPFGNIRYDACMEQRLFWMAEDPSTDPMSAWGHIGSQRSDGKPSEGCDGNLAGGSGNTGATVADKWWASSGHRASLYKPGNTGSMAGTCILFAMTHGGVPNEPYSFTRAAARWVSC